MLMGWLLPYPFLFFYLFLFLFPSHSSSLQPMCIHYEYTALLHFKNSFSLNNSVSKYCDGYQSSYPKTASWENGLDCCLWDGVTCDSISGHVIGLDLSCSWLEGQFHPNSTIFQLSHLQSLNLAFNNFSGSSISSQFGDLVTLTHLNLSVSQFSGEIPSKISQLSELVSLDLSANEFPSFEPSAWENLILNVTDLRELVLDDVDMSSIRPSSLSLLMNLSSSLVTLSLSHTGLEGKMANDILYLQNLQKLRLSGNGNLKVQLPKSNWSSPLRFLDLSEIDISGEIPNSLSHLKSLNVLSLYSCQFEGLVPASLGNLTQLTDLDLSSNNLSGEISFLSTLQHLTYLDLSFNNFSGQIPSSLSNLENLTYLDLSNNNFSGEIPNVFRKLTKLKVLSLSSNNLGGQFPSSFSNLTQLMSLGCASNKLIGPILNKICKLPNLVFLSLSNNLLNGTIPNGCFSSSSLQKLKLGKNHLTGPISPFSSHSLEICYLSYNKLEGNVHKSVFGLVNLTKLDFSSNNLSGHVNFHQFSKLQNLEYLDLSNNMFLSISFDNDVDYSIPSLGSLELSSCNINSFPRLGNLQNLYFLNLSYNNIHGKIPKWFNQVENGSLEILDLSHNKLTSAEDLSMRSLRFLDLSFNMLQGSLPIPSSITTFFLVSNNKFIGSISLLFCNASSLVILNLSHNNLTGPVPRCLVAFPYLSVLDLQKNNLVGTIPKNFPESNSLQTLHFNGNQLQGSLPLSLGNCTQLEVLDVGENKIEDTFPNWLEGLQELQVLVLKANKFHGVINTSNSKYPFAKLRIFDVSNNHFEGSLPTAYIKEFKGMMEVNDGAIGLQYMEHLINGSRLPYEDSVMVTMKAQNRELQRILKTFTTLDFSNNKFDGEIPKLIGDLSSLKGLNLSHNQITGSIPQSLGNLQSLEWLDLSSNKLTGEIPTTLTDLTFLSFLNLSQNQLEGIIPKGNQFDTFGNESYEGNLGLCGVPLSKRCKKDEGEWPPPSTTFEDDEGWGFGWKAIALGYGCGMIFGVVMGYVVCKTRKPQWLVRFFFGEPWESGRRGRNRTHWNKRRRN